LRIFKKGFDTQKMQAIVALDVGTNVRSGVTQEQVIHELGINICYLQEDDKSKLLKCSSERPPFTKVYMIRDDFPEFGDKEVKYKTQKDPKLQGLNKEDRVSFLSAISNLVALLWELDNEHIVWMFAIHNAHSFDIPTILYNLELYEGHVDCLNLQEKCNYLIHKLSTQVFCTAKQGACVVRKIPTEAQKRRLGPGESFARVSLSELHSHCFPSFSKTHKTYFHSTRFDAECVGEIYCHLHSNGHEFFPSPAAYLTFPRWKIAREHKNSRPSHHVLLRRKLFSKKTGVDSLKCLFEKLSMIEHLPPEQLSLGETDKKTKACLEAKDRLKRFLALERSRQQKIKFLVQQQNIIQEEIRKLLQQEAKDLSEGLHSFQEIQQCARDLKQTERSLLGSNLLLEIEKISVTKIPNLPPDPYVFWVPAGSLKPRGAEVEKEKKIDEEETLYSDEEATEEVDGMVVLPAKSSDVIDKDLNPNAQPWNAILTKRFTEICGVSDVVELIGKRQGKSIAVEGIQLTPQIELHFHVRKSTGEVHETQRTVIEEPYQPTQILAPGPESDIRKADRDLDQSKLATSFEIKNVDLSWETSSGECKYGFITKELLQQEIQIRDQKTTVQQVLQKCPGLLLTSSPDQIKPFSPQIEKLRASLSQIWGIGKYKNCTYAELLEKYPAYLKTYVIKPKKTKNTRFQDMKMFVSLCQLDMVFV
jgi:hypothetical protein